MLSMSDLMKIQTMENYSVKNIQILIKIVNKNSNKNKDQSLKA
jgi:hypothetical protein